MADALSSVPSANEEYKRQLLAAMASGGTAGAQAFQSGQQALTTAKGQAIDAATGLANLIGGPESQGFAPQAGSVYDRRIADLGAGQANFTENLAARGNAYDQYLSSVSAAVPLVRAQTERDLALKRMELDARDSAGGGLSDSEIAVRLLGAGRGLLSGAQKNLAGPVAFPDYAPGTNVGAHLSALESLAQERRNAEALSGRSAEELGQEIGLASGIDPNLVLGHSTLQPPKPIAPVETKNIMTWAKTDEKTAKTISQDPAYTEGRNQARTFLTAPTENGLIPEEGSDKYDPDWAQYAGMTPWDAYTLWLQRSLPANKTRTYDALVGEFNSKFSAVKAR